MHRKDLRPSIVRTSEVLCSLAPPSEGSLSCPISSNAFRRTVRQSEPVLGGNAEIDLPN